MRTRARTLAVACMAALVATLGVVAGPTGPAAAGSRYTPCIYPDGTDVQAKYGVHVPLVLPKCTQIKAGATWMTGMGWFGAKTWQQIPAGYVPVASTPLADLRAHLVGFRAVIDRGTTSELVVEFHDSPALWTAEDADYAYANAITLGTIRPLQVGSHTLERFIVTDATTCDGISSDPAVSCFGAGAYPYDPDPIHFQVVR